MKYIEKVRNYIRENNMIQAGDSVIVGVSGGADSVCLLLMLEELSRMEGFGLRIVNVEHGIRGEESVADSEFVVKLGESLGLPVFPYKINVPELAAEMKVSEEEAGRIMRYRIFEDARCKVGGDRIAVAHNANDNAETFIHNIIRGTSLKGLEGIPPVRGNIIRPLLCLTRAEIEESLKEAGAEYRHDSTNDSNDYTRNKIRNEILPLLKEINPATVEHINSLTEDTVKANAVLAKYVDKVYDEAVEESRKGDIPVSINITRLLGEDDIVKAEIIKKGITKVAGAARDIGRIRILDCMGLLYATTGKSLHLPYDVIAKTSYDKLLLYKKRKGVGHSHQNHDDTECYVDYSGLTTYGKCSLRAEIIENEKIQIEKNLYTKYIDYDRIECGLTVRHRRTGDTIVINESGGRAKLKDYFINEKIPAGIRDDIWLVCDGSSVVWVQGYRLSESYKVTDTTKRILKMELTED